MLSKNFKHLIFLLIILCFSKFAYSNRCGKQEIKPLIKSSPKIINGFKAVPNSWPWIVSLRYGTISNNSHFCGGSLIDSNTVITAAHCLKYHDNKFGPSDFIVAIGTNNIDEELVDGKNAFQVEKTKIHKNWDDEIILDDIAIIKLKKSVLFSSKIQPICLPTSSETDIVYNKDLIVAGWGVTSGWPGKKTSPNNLLQAKLRVITDSKLCNRRLKENYCAIDVSKRKSNACEGDSGGPLMYFINGRWHLYGIASYVITKFGTDCWNYEPSFYTRVPDYLKWIDRNRL